MYDIDWAQKCPNAKELKDYQYCFEEQNLYNSEIIPCEAGHVFDKTLFTSTVKVCSVFLWLFLSIETFKPGVSRN